MNKLSIIFLGLLATLAFGQEAIAVFYDVNNTGITGTASFVYNGTSVNVTISLSGIDREGSHGIHIHQYGDLRGLTPFNDGNSTVVGPASVGDHYNPDNYTHGCPTGNSTSHHNGDLGNWNVTGGIINESKVFNYLNITGLRSIVGRAIVLHNLTDDCNVTTSAGARRAIGLIGIAGNNTANTAGGPTNETAAVAVLMGTGNCQGSNCGLNNSGIVVFNFTNSAVQVSAQVWGLGEVRGFHIHWFGDLRDAQQAALMVGEHYNPDNTQHGLPGQITLHRGDLGNIQNFANDNAYYYFNPNNQLTIADILGRAVVIHSMLDHGDASSNCPNASMSGDAGTRVWVGVIAVANPSVHLSGPNVSAVQVYNNTFEDTPCSDSPTPAPQPAPEGAPEPQGPTPTPTPTVPATPTVTPVFTPSTPTPALPVAPSATPVFITPTATPTPNAGGKFLFSSLLFALALAFAICQ